jgi:hypothetical protein
MNARQIEIFSAEGRELGDVADDLQRSYAAWLKSHDPIVVSTQTTHQTVVGNPDDPVEYHFMTLTAMYRPRALRQDWTNPDDVKPESDPDDLPNEEDLAF